MPRAPRTERPYPGAVRAGTLRSMDDAIPAEALPSLYRSVLETVARLERAGERSFALDLRRRAVRVYSTRWDEGGRRSLEKLDREAHARLAASRQAGTRAGALARTESA
jgi:hypothetical protein